MSVCLFSLDVREIYLKHPLFQAFMFLKRKNILDHLPNFYGKVKIKNAIWFICALNDSETTFVFRFYS